ncbi:MAG: methyltransferase domain-containing protein [Ruminococcus sp.]|nr:methyltransferase domain-containing protein [Ruminococcus sp.]
MENNNEKVLKLLNKFAENAGYSNLLLQNTADVNPLQTRLFYGVIERLITLDFIISNYNKKKLDIEVRNILRLGLYQLLYINSIKDFTVVNECVSVCKKFKKTSASGLVNFILRQFIRDGKKFDDNDLSVKYSVNSNLLNTLLSQYEQEIVIQFLEDSFLPPILFKRYYFPLNDNVNNHKNRNQSEIFHIQDLSSQYACEVLAPKPGQIVLDMCSAPGGKAFTLAEIMQNKGTVYAVELHESRCSLIKSGAEKLGLTNIKIINANSAEISDLPKADKILCDVPCSGIGVIRRKPEIKYKDPSEFETLPDIQYKILKNAVRFLKPDGDLIYSTCTINKNENEKVVEKFISENKDYEIIKTRTIFPKEYGSDGFFISHIRRVNGANADTLTKAV